MSARERVQETCGTYQIEVQLVLKQVKTLDDILVVDERHDHHLGRHAPEQLVVPPRVLGHLVLNDELDRGLVPGVPVARRHDEAVPARAELVAERLGGPVVSVDAMQVYRGMDVGTAKTPVAERRVPLLMVDVVVNNVMGLKTDLSDLSTYMFKDKVGMLHI